MGTRKRTLLEKVTGLETADIRWEYATTNFSSTRFRAFTSSADQKSVSAGKQKFTEKNSRNNILGGEKDARDTRNYSIQFAPQGSARPAVQEDHMHQHTKHKLLLEIFENEILEHKECDWQNVAALCNEDKRSSRLWTSQVMGILSGSTPVPFRNEKAMSLMKYIRETGTPSVAHFSFLIKILGTNGFSSVWEDTICDLYDELRMITDVFDRVSGSTVIRGLTKTRRWKECLQIFDDNDMLPVDLSYIAEAAFHYRDIETGFELLRKIEVSCVEQTNWREMFNTAEKVYLGILRSNSTEDVLRMLDLMKQLEVVTSQNVAQAVGDWFCA